MKDDEFGDRMKQYEREYTSARIPVTDILCVRIDGKNFSKYTKSFTKPFDQRMTDLMVNTTYMLVKELRPDIGYTQSDEITLIFAPSEKQSEYVLSGKVSKLNSVIASMASAFFNKQLPTDAPPAFFDCRSWGVPNMVEASNVLLWRAQDARKNSVSALFRWTAGHKTMHGLNGQQMATVLENEYDVRWKDLPNQWKYGTYIKPVVKDVIIDDVPVKRTVVEKVDVGFYGDYDLPIRVKMIRKESDRV